MRTMKIPFRLRGWICFGSRCPKACLLTLRLSRARACVRACMCVLDNVLQNIFRENMAWNEAVHMKCYVLFSQNTKTNIKQFIIRLLPLNLALTFMQIKAKPNDLRKIRNVFQNDDCWYFTKHAKRWKIIQSNFNGSNIFGTIKNCSRHG